MAFFPRNYYNNESASFTPLFRLLEDFDSYARQGQQSRSTSRNTITFQPKFDVRELENHFELHGELAGLKKEDVDVEFTDPHTLRIHGRIVRTYTSGTPPSEESAKEASGALVDGTAQPSSPKKSQQATVEDDNDDVEWTSNDSAEGPVVEADSTSQPQKTEKQVAKHTPADRAKYWCTERSVGEFSRTFNFPGNIQQDAVSASLDNGILTIKVPKAPKHETRRIAIL